jgi:diguanylate cyclase (GGDEF)-like protein/PAS domain S-box-containing protein
MAKARLVAGIRSMLSVLLVGVLLPAAASIPPAPALQLTQAEQAWLSMHPDITVAVNHGWEPISFISENGEMRGIALDYLDAIEKQLGVHFRRVRSVEDPTLETADILLAVPRPAALTGTRFQALPSPYIEMPFAIFTRGESNGIHRLEDLSGKKVAVFKTGTVAQSLAREHPQVQLYKADIAEEGLSALLHGSVDAYIGNRTIVTHVAHHQGFGNIKIVGTTPYRASIYLATRNDWPVLAEILQKTLQAIPAQENQRIQHNWEVIRYERETSQLWLLAGGGTLLAFISLFALWNWRVSRAERQRTRRRERTRNQVLELLAKNAPLNDILHAIVHAVELENPEMLCSILLIDGSGQHVLLGAAPRLPDFYNAAIHGAAIGPAEGSCGSAAYLGIRVVVSDIRTHPYWEKYRVLAERAGLRACWSEPIKNSSGKVIGTFAIYHREPRAPSGRDIRLIEQAANLAGLAIEQGRINEELQLALMVYRNSNEAMMVTDPEGVILTTNEAFTRITGRRPEEVIGKRPETLAEDVQFVFFREAMKALDRQGSWQGEIADRRKNGEAYVKWLTINTIFGEDGLPHRRVVLFYDITEKKKAEELIWQQANFDPLTGLPNRRMFQERLVQEMKKAQRAKLPLALLFLDLDRFKEVNDTLGHGMGDQLLKEAARRLNQCVRGTDTVARLGGDEFTVILTALDTPNSVERVVNDILRHISEPYWLGDDQAYVTTSIGITLYPDDAADIDTLLRNADQAMYAAKQMGRNRSCYFTPSMQEAAQTRMRLGTDLRSALAE